MTGCGWILYGVHRPMLGRPHGRPAIYGNLPSGGWKSSVTEAYSDDGFPYTSSRRTHAGLRHFSANEHV